MRQTTSLGIDTIEPLGDFDSFFHTNFERVARSAAFVTRDAGTGQDLAQEAFTRLLERWSEMTSPEHARNFAYRVAMNLARSHLRKHLRVFLYGLHRRDDVDGGSATASSDAWFEVAQALGTLSPRQRECVVLVDYADMDTARAATVLGLSPATVRVHVMRGRRSLRECLGIDPREEQP
ncbi:MAG: RNA polymerase sigma factor [Actinomycetota bacterium]